MLANAHEHGAATELNPTLVILALILLQQGKGGDMASAFLIAERLYDIDALWADIDAAEMAESARFAIGWRGVTQCFQQVRTNSIAARQFQPGS